MQIRVPRRGRVPGRATVGPGIRLEAGLGFRMRIWRCDVLHIRVRLQDGPS